LTKEKGYLEDDENIPSDPSKLRLAEAVELWTRWQKKQDDGFPGLAFVKGLTKDLRLHTKRGRNGKAVGKQWRYMDPEDSDAGEGKEGEGEEGEEEVEEEGEVDELDSDGEGGEGDDRGEKGRVEKGSGKTGQGRDGAAKGKGNGGRAGMGGKGKGKEKGRADEGGKGKGKGRLDEGGKGKGKGREGEQGKGKGKGREDEPDKEKGKGQEDEECNGKGDGSNSGEGGVGSGGLRGVGREGDADASDQPHISSPACHSETNKTKSKFLRGLTKEAFYLKLIKITQSVSLEFYMCRGCLLIQLGERLAPHGMYPLACQSGAIGHTLTNIFLRGSTLRMGTTKTLRLSSMR
jgi:hypothetical protein